jgi:cell division septal protein FtsQ
MKYFLFLFILSIAACSNQDRVNTETVTFDLSKELISSLDEAKNQITTHILNKQEPLTSDFFQESWISVIKTTNTFNKDVIVEIKEHQPMASLGKDRFITQEGKIISPKEKTKNMNLIKIFGSEQEAHSLLDNAILLQNILNIREKNITRFEHKGSGFIEAEDDTGSRYSFTKGDFRVQLERLEEFILFELNSGNKDHIRYIDLRYKNAIAVSHFNMEKTI